MIWSTNRGHILHQRKVSAMLGLELRESWPLSYKLNSYGNIFGLDQVTGSMDNYLLPVVIQWTKVHNWRSDLGGNHWPNGLQSPYNVSRRPPHITCLKEWISVWLLIKCKCPLFLYYPKISASFFWMYYPKSSGVHFVNIWYVASFPVEEVSATKDKGQV